MSSDEKAAREVRAWIRARIAELPRFSQPAIAREALAHFSERPKFLGRLLGDEAYRVFYRLVAETTGANRVVIFSDGEVLRGDVADMRRALGESRASVFDTWTEWVDESQVRLRDLTASMLEKAISNRHQRASREMRVARFLEALRPKMKRGKTVGESVSDIELYDLWHETADSQTQDGAA